MGTLMADSGRRSSACITTPDQRLRDFVSSALNELAAEREAARAAIEQLQLAPVSDDVGTRLSIAPRLRLPPARPRASSRPPGMWPGLPECRQP
jgi:hypothetical protein